MNTLIVYDSLYGNTEQIARAMAIAEGETRVHRVGEVPRSELGMFELVVVGCPTQGGKPTKAMQDFLDGLPLLSNMRVAAFDTRLTKRWVKVFGFVADKIAAKDDVARRDSRKRSGRLHCRGQRGAAGRGRVGASRRLGKEPLT